MKHCLVPEVHIDGPSANAKRPTSFQRHHLHEMARRRQAKGTDQRLHEDDGRIVSNFVVQALTGVPITVYGDGRQTCSFCYVSDMIEGLVRLMASGPAVAGPINLGNPQEVSVLNLAQRIIRLTRSASRLGFGPLPADDPRRRRPDIASAARLLGWQPKMNLEHGLPHWRQQAVAARRPPALRPLPLRTRRGRSCCSRWSRSSRRSAGRGRCGTRRYGR
jgi:hypothetical protein